MDNQNSVNIIKQHVKEEGPDTPEKYLLKRVVDLEEELAEAKRFCAQLSSQLAMTRALQKDKAKEAETHFEMLRFLMDYVIDRYDPIMNYVCVGSKHIGVPGKLQDDFKLWQSFKDNPEGGGV